MKRISALFALLFCLLLLALPTLATEEKPTIGLSGDAYPLVGKEVQILVSHASYPHLENFSVKVIYRPNSNVEQEEVLGHTNDNGIIAWTPKHAGITTITAEAPALDGIEAVKLSKNISVRFGHFPPLGILIFALAATTLFGGLILILIKSTRSAKA